MRLRVPIDMLLAHEVGGNIGNERRLGRIIDQRREHVGEANLSCRAKGCSDARRSAPHAILDLLHRVIAECSERAADRSRLRNDVIGISGLNGCHADDCRIRRFDVA